VSDTQLELDLNPDKVLASLGELTSSVKKLAEDIDKALGKKAVDSIDKLEHKSETGTNKIQKFFSNLGQRVKEDLKTAFDTSAVLEGAKFAKDMQEGAKQVLEMERAFSKLNTRLGLSADKLNDFKRAVNSKIALTGQKTEDILPGVESAASRGGIADTNQLSNIAEILGKVKASTGEDVGSLSDSAIEILKHQGIKVTADSFKSTIDAIQGSRVNSGFKTAGEASSAIQNLTKGLTKEQMKDLGLDTRKMGGLAAVASKSGEQGTEVLKSLLSTDPGMKSKVNSILGQNVFVDGKFNQNALGKVDTKRFGAYSQQIMGGALGADQADLARMVDGFKESISSFDSVVNGTNETAKQFEVATDNWAAKYDKFKATLKSTAANVGGDLTSAAYKAMNGDFKGAGVDLSKSGTDLNENKTEVAAGFAATAAVALLAGGAMNNLLGKIPGVGGAVSSVVGGAAAEAAGVQKVFVTNMSSGGMGSVESLGMTALFSTVGSAIGVAAAVGLGSYIGKSLGETDFAQSIGDKIGDALRYFDNMEATDKGEASGKKGAYGAFLKNNNTDSGKISMDEYAAAVENGTLKALKAERLGNKPQYLNPSDIKGRQ